MMAMTLVRRALFAVALYALWCSVVAATNDFHPSEVETTDETQPSEVETTDGTQTSEVETTDGTQPSEVETTDGTQPSDVETTDGTQPSEVRAAKKKADESQLTEVETTDGSHSSEVKVAREKAMQARRFRQTWTIFWEFGVLANTTELLSSLAEAEVYITQAEAGAKSAKDTNVVSALKRVRDKITAGKASAAALKSEAEGLNKTLEEAAKRDEGLNGLDDLSSKEAADALETTTREAAIWWDLVLQRALSLLETAAKAATDATNARARAEAVLATTGTDDEEKKTKLKQVTDALSMTKTALQTSEKRARDVRMSAETVRTRVNATKTLWREAEELAGELHKMTEDAGKETLRETVENEGSRETLRETEEGSSSVDGSRLMAFQRTTSLPFFLFACAAAAMVAA